MGWEAIEMCYECVLQALYHRCDNILNKSVFNYFGSLAANGCKNWHFLLISISMNDLDPFIFNSVNSSGKKLRTYRNF